MNKLVNANSSFVCKDASSDAPSVKCAHNSNTSTSYANVAVSAVNCADFMNIIALTDIAAAVSVFLFSIISIIAYGIIICFFDIMPAIIMSYIFMGIITSIIIFAIIYAIKPYTTKAKLY